MRFVMMHRLDEKKIDGVPPSPELMAGMGKLVEDLMQAGVMRGTDGLRASKHGVRLNFVGGKRTITQGPLSATTDLPAGFSIVRTKTLDDAIELGTRFAEIVGDVEMDVRPVNEPWDVGMMPKPDGLDTTRYMLLRKADPQTESGKPLPSEIAAKLGKLMGELSQSGVLLQAEALQPSSKGVRLKFAGGERTITDGPFAEAKELIAGFCVVEVETLEEAIHWSTRFANCIGDVDVDIRLANEPPVPPKS
jgi:hypothetical protein